MEEFTKKFKKSLKSEFNSLQKNYEIQRENNMLGENMARSIQDYMDDVKGVIECFESGEDLQKYLEINKAKYVESFENKCEEFKKIDKDEFLTKFKDQINLFNCESTFEFNKDKSLNDEIKTFTEMLINEFDTVS